MLENEALDPLDEIDLDALRVLALSVADVVEAKYPGLPVLNPKQVADVLKGRTDRATVNGVRDRLTAGTLIPGLPKRGGRWEIPTEDLIRIYDGMVQEAERALAQRRATVAPTASAPRAAGKRPWRAKIGPRKGIFGFAEAYAPFFREMYRELDLLYADDEAAILRQAFDRELPSNGRRGL